MLADAVTTPAATVVWIIWAVLAVAASYVYVSVLSRPPRVTATDDDIVRRVMRNSAIPIASQLFIRASDLAVAIVLLRLLGPEGNGRYALAVVIWLYVKTISDFGFTLLATRDIARDRTLAGELVGATTLLRILILAIAGLPVAFYIFTGLFSNVLATETAVAIGILYLSIVPSSYSEAVNSALNGFERMDLAAGINIGVSLVRAPLVILLAATSLGIIGVAIAACVTAILSADLFRRTFARVADQSTIFRVTRARAVSLVRQSWPLLVNAILINLFFRLDVFLIQAYRGDAALGIYDASYKLINLVTIIPAYATLAIFPAMAIRAHDSAALSHAQRLTSYLLVWGGWAIVAIVTATAGTAIRILAGNDYLPEAATLLRLLIWFAPVSFLNGVIQYVLVAAGQQHRIVPAFMAAVTFNFGANLALVPTYGVRAAAIITVLTEVIILLAFAVVTRNGPQRVVTRDTVGRIWRPTVVGAIAAATALVLVHQSNEFFAALSAVIVFAGLSMIFGVIGPEEWTILRRAARRPQAASST